VRPVAEVHRSVVASAVDRQSVVVRVLRTPQAAAVAGIIFAVLLSIAVVLLHWAIPRENDPGEWLTEESRRRAVAIAMALIPYAGIAFLWFIGVIRSQLGAREDKLFATAFLGSGLLFVAMLFTAAAVTGALLDLYGESQRVSTDDARLASAIVIALLGTFSIRMAAVFTLVATNLVRRAGIAPTWLVIVGYATAGGLLFAPPRTVWATLLFPGWVFLLSVVILVLSLRGRGTQSSRAGEANNLADGRS
jgi:MFS family permease